MLTINAKLEGHRLTITGTPQLAADSARVDRVKFDFDDEWTGFSRVALFWGSDGEDPYAVAVDGQGYAVIPWETIQEKGRMRFGVYGIKGTSRITSTVLKYQIQDGAWSASPANPGEITPTMLEQLQALVETAVEQMDDRLAEFDAAVETFYPHSGGVGALVTVEGTVDASPAGLTIYGMSLQEGATPTPDAPADIVTAGSSGTLSMVSAGKNLIRRFVNTSGTGTGCSWTFDAETGTYTLTSTAGSGSEKAVYAGEIGVRNAAGQTLTFSAESITGDSNASVRIFWGNTSVDHQLAMVYGSTLSATFQVPNDEPLYMVLRMGNTTASGVTAILKGVQLEVGSARTDFAPMLDKLTAAISTPNGLPGIPVASGGNYIDTGETRWICDTIDLESGTWTKRCGVVTLDGSENWIASTQVAGRYYLASTYTPDAVPYASHLCTHAVANPGSSTSDTGKSFFASGANFDINTEYASVEAFKAALATVNMVLVYALAAPVVTQLTEAQIAALRALRGRKGLTNLYSADPAGPEFRAEMYIDIPTYIKDLVAANGNTMVFSVSE